MSKKIKELEDVIENKKLETNNFLMAESNSEDIEKYIHENQDSYRKHILAKEMRMTSFESNMRIGTVEYQRRGQCDFRASSTTVAAMAKELQPKMIKIINILSFSVEKYISRILNKLHVTHIFNDHPLS